MPITEVQYWPYLYFFETLFQKVPLFYNRSLCSKNPQAPLRVPIRVLHGDLNRHQSFLQRTQSTKKKILQAAVEVLVPLWEEVALSEEVAEHRASAGHTGDNF